VEVSVGSLPLFALLSPSLGLSSHYCVVVFNCTAKITFHKDQTAFSIDFLFEICLFVLFSVLVVVAVHANFQIATVFFKTKHALEQKPSRHWIFKTTKDFYKLAGVKSLPIGWDCLFPRQITIHKSDSFVLFLPFLFRILISSSIITCFYSKQEFSLLASRKSFYWLKTKNRAKMFCYDGHFCRILPFLCCLSQPHCYSCLLSLILPFSSLPVCFCSLSSHLFHSFYQLSQLYHPLSLCAALLSYPDCFISLCLSSSQFAFCSPLSPAQPCYVFLPQIPL